MIPAAIVFNTFDGKIQPIAILTVSLSLIQRRTNMPIKPASLLVLVVVFSFSFFASSQRPVVAQESSAPTPSALDFTMKSITGDQVKLSRYAGKVVVLVNVASKCGFTDQYKQLQELHSKYADKGVAVIGIPCNQFRGQEPGSDDEILAFCKKKYDVEFDMLSKVDVNGSNQCELYKHLNSIDVKPRGKGDVKWNFEKYILDRTGKPVARFGSKVKPDSKQFMAVIKKALGTNQQQAGYSHVSQKSGKTYYLFSKDVPLKNSDRVQTIYYFAKDPNNPKGTALSEVPAGKVVSETKSGLPILKNDGTKKKK